jgi:hypothetical protein
VAVRLSVQKGHDGVLRPTAHYFLTSGFATARAQSIKSRAAALSTRFFKVRIPIGPMTIGNSIGNFLMKGCLEGKVSTDSGWIARYRPVPSRLTVISRP